MTFAGMSSRLSKCSVNKTGNQSLLEGGFFQSVDSSWIESPLIIKNLLSM
jgi:hypothetical protein